MSGRSRSPAKARQAAEGVDVGVVVGKKAVAEIGFTQVESHAFPPKAEIRALDGSRIGVRLSGIQVVCDVLARSVDHHRDMLIGSPRLRRTRQESLHDLGGDLRYRSAKLSAVAGLHRGEELRARVALVSQACGAR